MAVSTAKQSQSRLQGTTATRPLDSDSTVVRSRAPLRIGLSGGGTDVSPYCDNFGGAVLNATIDRYAYATIKMLNNGRLRFVASDQQVEAETTTTASLELTGKLDLHRAVYREIMHRYNNGRCLSLELSTFCDAPIGSGLGASSTLVVTMIRAFAELLNLPMDDYTIAGLAFKIERIDCSLQGGRQDQYSATFGGFNFMEFYNDNRVIVNSLRIKNQIISELEASLILVNTGVSRESAHIIADQSAGVKSNQVDVLAAMHTIKQEAVVMKECLLKGDFAGIVASLQRGWEHKKLSAKTVSSELVEEIFTTAINTGALAGKVSGAGGGGFIMFYVPPDKRMDVIRAVNQTEGEGLVSNCHFTKQGVQAWTV